MRNLASIQKIAALDPIENADSIVRATVLGWHVVVKKDEFKVGDKCVYIEIDSIVPKDNPIFAFLEPRKYRVRTIKLRGQVSQGLCLPISLFPELEDKLIDTDVTEILKITKYDPEAQLERQVVSKKKPDNWLVKVLMRFSWFRKLRTLIQDKTKGFPSDIISKSDEERVQTIPWLIKDHEGEIVSYTEKLDGQSYTATLRRKKLHIPFIPRYEFVIASRNLRVNPKENNNYADVTKRYHIYEKLRSYLKNHKNYTAIAIQGEICGPGIQKNKYGFTENHLFLFRVKYILNNGMEHVLSQSGTTLFADELKLESVPFLGIFTLTSDIDKLVELAGAEKSAKANIEREGIVIREDKSDFGFSFKVINPKFLLKFDE